MGIYTVKTPKLVSKVFRNYFWKMPTEKKEVFLTFDDGPTPGVSDKTLKILDKYNIKATFFVVGNQVRKYPTLLKEIEAQKHTIGNHTYSHLNGWKHMYKKYKEEIFKTHILIKSIINKEIQYFRPPYGKFSYFVRNYLLRHYKIIMWDVLAGDFDPNLTEKDIIKNVVKNVEKGSIIVLHDSLKCKKKLLHTLEPIIENILEQGFSFGEIPNYV